MNTVAPSAPTDFDFMIGIWMVSHRRLNERLVGCDAWTEFSGTSSTRHVLEGFGNVEDNYLDFPEGGVRALALRSFNPETKTWAIWWLDGRAPHNLDVPVVGAFSAGVGEFYAQDSLAGNPIQVRFLWHTNDGLRPTWEQAFSPDSGKTWETNWTMKFTRVAA